MQFGLFEFLRERTNSHVEQNLCTDAKLHLKNGMLCWYTEHIDYL